MTLVKTPDLPQACNIEAEQAVLGALLMNNEVFHYLGDLQPSHFFEPLHQCLFTEAKRQHEAGLFVSPLTLKDSFPDVGAWPGGLKISHYLARLAAEGITSSPVHVESYSAQIQNLAQLRAMSDVLYRLVTARESLEAPDIAMREAYDKIDLIRTGGEYKTRLITTTTVGEAALSVMETMQAQLAGTKPVCTALTGISALDKITGGFKPGELIICAGRPSMGKSSLGSSIARGAAAGVVDGNGEIRQAGTAFFSLEMPRELITARLLADQAFDTHDPIHYTAITKADLGIKRELQDSRHQRLVEAQIALNKMPFILDTSPKLSIGELAAKSRAIAGRLRKDYNAPLGLIVVDYLKFITAPDRYRGQMAYEIGEISAALKGLARELNCAVLLLAQLNRQVEQRADKRPELSDLRASGDLESDADVVMLLFREAYYLRNNPNVASDPALEHKLSLCENSLEIIIAKQRMGPTGSVSVYCNMACSAVRSA